jgi:anti-sigma factor RsiW
VNLQCQDIDELLVDFLYHELEEPRAQAFQAHVDGCARCGAELSSLARMRQALHALPEAEPSPAVSARLLHEAARRAPKSEEERGGVLAWIRGFFGPLARHPAWAGAIASIIVVVGLAGVLTLSRRSVPADLSTTRSVEPAAAAPAPPAAPPSNLHYGDTLKAEAPATVPAVSEDKPAAEPKAGKLDRVGRTTTPAEEGTIRPVRGEKKKAAVPSLDESAEGLSAPKDAEKLRDVDLGRARQAEQGNDDRKQGAGAPAGGDSAGNERAKSSLQPSAAQAAPAQTEYRADPQKGVSKESPSAAKPSKAPSMPASKMPAPEPTTAAHRSLGGAREQDKAQEKAPPTPPELHQQARKQATSGACVEALTIRDQIARVDPGYFNKNVAGDAEINRCLEQQRRSKADSKRPAAPSQPDEAEKKVDDKASKDAAH